MKVDVGLFVVVVALCACTVAALWVPEVPGGHGVAHPDYPSMRHGGDGAARHAGVLWIGWGIGVLEILALVGAMALGAQKGGSLRGLGKPFAWGTVAYVAVWTWLVLAYRSYEGATDPPLYLALPAPTALMMYVLLPVPLIFVAFFVSGFRRWVLSADDQRKFRRIVALRGARRRAGEEDAGAGQP